MKIRWFGQSAFLLTGERSVAIDPFGPSMAELTSSRGIVFDYPPIDGVEADLLLITHEHADHNAAEAIGGAPVVIRSTAGTIDSPLGDVVAVASEHDELAGTVRGPNTIFRFELDGLQVCHLGDFGQAALRPEQEQAIGQVDLLFVPVGGGPTVGGEARGGDRSRPRGAARRPDALPHRGCQLPRAAGRVSGGARRPGRASWPGARSSRSHRSRATTRASCFSPRRVAETDARGRRSASGPRRLVSSGGWARTTDLRVMSPAL